jgi:hypothetical protein
VNAGKRPRFLLDLAGELFWLKDKAGTKFVANQSLSLQQDGTIELLICVWNR